MIAAANSGCLTLEKLEAMTAVCSVGLDMIAVPGDTSPAVISALIADELSIGVANTKTTAVRLIPAIGKKEGDSLSFGGLLGDAPIVRINQADPSAFIARGGRIPAPIHSLKTKTMPSIKSRAFYNMKNRQTHMRYTWRFRYLDTRRDFSKKFGCIYFPLVFKRRKQAKLFGHDTTFNRIDRCLFQTICKLAKLGDIVQFAAFAQCA